MCAPVVAAGISAAASIGMGIYSANQSASMAGQQMAQAAQQAQANVAIQNEQAMMQQRQSQAQMAQQRQQFLQSQQAQARQQFQQQQFAAKQQQQSQLLSIQQQQQSQMQAARLQQQQQMLSIRQQTQQQKFQAEMQQAQMLQSMQQQGEQNRLQVQQQQDALRQQKEQAAASRNLQIEQMNAQLADKYTQQREAVKAERAQLMQKHQVDKRLYQDSKETAQQQMKNNAEEANRVYTAEQARLEGKRKEAAFEAQSILAKSIGAKGSILASGRTGQSIGLLVNDVERQAGIQKAQQTAMLESDRVAAIIGMEDAFAKNRAGNQQAASQVGFNPDMPYLPKMPEVPTFVGFEIPK